MPINYSLHAFRRISERGVHPKEVESTIYFPDKLVEKDDAMVAMKMRENNHLLIVIYSAYKGRYNVITVISTSKVNKYL